MQFGIFNALDLLLIIILSIGIIVGMIRGIVPQLMSLVSIWLGLVVTLWLYKPFSVRMLQGVGMSAEVSDTISFLLLLVVFVNLIRLVVKMLSTPPEERKMKKKSKDDPLADAAKSALERFVVGPLNLIGGGLLGFILTALWIALILGGLQFVFQPGMSGSAGGFAFRMSTSFIGSYFLPWFNQLLLLLARSVSWFVPDYADIMDKALQRLS